MKKSFRLLAIILVVILTFSAMPLSAFAKKFAPAFDISNPGIQTQYLYSENNASWVRKLVVKEDMLSAEGIANEAVLYPVTDYPYNTDAPHFKAAVEESIKTYTLDEDSQRAAYIYLLEQVGALNIISDPEVSEKTKADWLRAQGIIVTEEDEKDPDKLLMINALYAMMRNDLYYVYKGEHLTIPAGTPLEEAVVIYIAALSGQNSLLTAFISKFFGTGSFGDLEDYMYYTALMTLYTNGYVSATEVTKLSRDEVYKRLAVMTIRNYGIAIDSEKATTEELRQKYLTAMLGTHYKVSLDPESLEKSKTAQTIPYYILQRMAYEDANLTISQTKYTFEQCFNTVLLKTDRFDLDNEFYSDIYEYNIYLKNARQNISVSSTPLMAESRIAINGTSVVNGEYAKVNLKNVQHQILNIACRYTANGKTTTSNYKLNIYQGVTPAPDSNITGIIPTYGPTPDNSNGNNNSNNSINGGNGNGSVNVSGDFVTPTLPSFGGLISGVNGSATNLLGQILSLNDKGQLVDQDGNVVSQKTYETLPEGYKYVLGDDGIIQIVLIDETTTDALDSTSTDDAAEKSRKIIIIVSLIVCIALIVAMIITLVVMNKNKGMSKKDKERAKKAKKEARAERRERNKKK